MVTLLAGIFIRDAKEYDDPTVRRKYGMLCGAFGILLNILLFGFKFFAGMVSGSVAITADAFNNLSDAGSSLITLVGFRAAGMRPDKEHPFGHGRVEYVSGFVVAVLVLLMGLELLKDSVEKIIRPQQIFVSGLSVAILAVSILVKAYMAYYNHSMGKKLGSSAMKATAVDSLSDMAATSVVLMSIGIVELWGINADGWCGILVAVFILFAGYQAARETISPLLGVKPEPEFIDKIYSIVLSHEEVVGVHDIIVHDYGPGRVMLSLHAEVPGEEDIYRLHEVIDTIEGELDSRLQCESVIHMDPVEAHNEKVLALRKEVEQFVREFDESLSIHDFRMAGGKAAPKMIFDVVTPQEYALSDWEVRDYVEREIAKHYPEYICVIKVEKAYV